MPPSRTLSSTGTASPRKYAVVYGGTILVYAVVHKDVALLDDNVLMCVVVYGVGVLVDAVV